MAQRLVDAGADVDAQNNSGPGRPENGERSGSRRVGVSRPRRRRVALRRSTARPRPNALGGGQKGRPRDADGAGSASRALAAPKSGDGLPGRERVERREGKKRVLVIGAGRFFFGWRICDLNQKHDIHEVH